MVGNKKDLGNLEHFYDFKLKVAYPDGIVNNPNHLLTQHSELLRLALYLFLYLCTLSFLFLDVRLAKLKQHDRALEEHVEVFFVVFTLDECTVKYLFRA